MSNLGRPAGYDDFFFSNFGGLNADGTLAFIGMFGSGSDVGFIVHTATKSYFNLQNALIEAGAGAAIAGWSNFSCFGITDDGNTLFGWAINPAGRKEGFIARFPTDYLRNLFLLPPIISSPLAALATTGQSFTYQIVGSDGPTSYTATNLPPGLSVNTAHGVITGIPTAAGKKQVTISATNAKGTTIAILAITVEAAFASGPVITSGTAVTARAGQPFSFQVRASGVTSGATITASGLPSGLTINSATGVISGTVGQAGSHAATLTVKDGNATTTGSLQLSFTADAAVPVITSPTTANVQPGQSFSYTITAPNSAGGSDPTIYSISGTLPEGLTFDPTTGTISGTYSPGGARLASTAPTDGDSESLTEPPGAIISTITLIAHNSHGTATATLTFLTPGLVGNVSTRLPVGTDDNVLIEGFIVQGPAGSTKKIMVRAIGPSLVPFGIPDALGNPTLEIKNGSNVTVARNDDWKTTQTGGLITANQFAEINGSGLAPGNDLESAIIANLAPGNYTAVVAGLNNTTGTGVVDAYDMSAASPARLANVATRGLIQPGDKLMIGGFIIQNGPVKTVIRAIGPSLTAFGITNALPDTTLQLRNQNGVIVRENDDWKTEPAQKQELENVGLQPSHNLEAALITNLQPGQYTAQVRGKGQASGIGVVQVYFLQ
jgi:uncharacterized repeat protein (TIGR01451 family)